MAQRAEQRDALLQLGRIEAGEPLVEQQQVGSERQRARKLEPLLVDVGELLGMKRGLAGESDASEQPFGADSRRPAPQPRPRRRSRPR